jgi:hypothetical protein
MRRPERFDCAEQGMRSRRLISEGKPVRQIAETFNVHAATV